MLEESLSNDFIDFYMVQLDCPTESNFYVSMAAIQIPWSVFGLMINVYPMHLKPIDELNVACFSLICAGSNIHYST